MLKSYEAYDLRKKIFFLNSEGKAAYFRGSYISINSAFSGLSLNETYLIIAVTNTRLDRVSEALLWLNKLLEKRWTADKFVSKTAPNAEEALNLILLERRKELVGRGTRWFDLRRLNLENDNQIQVLTLDSLFIFIFYWGFSCSAC